MRAVLRRALIRLAVAIFCFAVAAGIGELGVRAAGLAAGVIPVEVSPSWGTFVASDNPILRYEPRPGAGDINADGQRDRGYPREKPADAYRIVVLGDSIGFGLCVPDVEALFHSIVERRLSGDPELPFGRVEAINLSVSGYDSRQEVERLRVRGLELAPDLVLVSFCLNDFVESSWELGAFREDPAWRINRQLGLALERHLVLRSHLFRLLVARSPGLARHLEADLAPLHDATAPPGRDRVEEAFRRLAGMAETHAFEVLVVVWPELKDLRGGERHRSDRETVAALGAELGFEVLDLHDRFDALAEDGNARPFSCDGWHPNEAGHRVAADALTEDLRARLGPARR